MAEPPPLTPELSEKVRWLREFSPYLHAHRGRTFVIHIPGEAVDSDGFDRLAGDFALLAGLGIRLILVHGIRPQIDRRLREQSLKPQFAGNLRITDRRALTCALEASGSVRAKLEARLSMSLSAAPDSRAGIGVVTGNLIIAKPVGVRGGIDFGHTGEVRKIDQARIEQYLALGHVILLSPIGYSPSGDALNLQAEALATAIAQALSAEKLIFLTDQLIEDPATGALISQMTTDEAIRWAERQPLPTAFHYALSAARSACEHGVRRAHLIPHAEQGGLLLELFSRAGIGTLLSQTPYEQLRPARIQDIPGILALIQPLERQGQLASRSREWLETQIQDYIVLDLDGLIIATAALHIENQSHSALIASMAVHPEYRRQGRASRLLSHLENNARRHGVRELFALSTQTMDWFIERGYQNLTLPQLPETLRGLYRPERNSRILGKIVS